MYVPLEIGSSILGANCLPLLATALLRSCTFCHIRVSSERWAVIVFIDETYEMPVAVKPPIVVTITIWKFKLIVSFIPFFHFGFWSPLATKLQNYKNITKCCYNHFFYILLGKMGKTEKQQKENYATKMTKIHKAKRQKHGINETFQNWVFMLSWAFCLKVRCNSKNVPNQITFLSRKL